MNGIEKKRPLANSKIIELANGQIIGLIDYQSLILSSGFL